jgi:hypothetical protein
MVGFGRRYGVRFCFSPGFFADVGRLRFANGWDEAWVIGFSLHDRKVGEAFGFFFGLIGVLRVWGGAMFTSFFSRGVGERSRSTGFEAAEAGVERFFSSAFG